MFIIYPVILGILVGYIAGGSLKWLIMRPFHWKLLAISAFLIQVVIFSDFRFLKSYPETAVTTLHYVSYILLLAFILRNVKVSGIALVGVGIFLNSLVIFVNGGYMPTLPENLKSTSIAKHAEAISQGNTVHNSSGITSQTLLPWLGDIFYIPSWVPFSNVFSIGDVLIGVGIFIYFLINMRPTRASSQTVNYVNIK